MNNNKCLTLNKIFKSSLLVAAISTLSACNDSDTDNNESLQTGVFIDSPVININYRTESNNGTTNNSGEFSYLPGEKITFYIGNIELPEVLASDLITPIDMAKAVSDDANIQSSIIVNIARLLQTLDLDQNPTNGIEISSDITTAANINFAASLQNFAGDFSALMPDQSLVDAASALAHIQNELNERNIDTSILDDFAIDDDDSGDNGGDDSGDNGGGDDSGDNGGGDDSGDNGGGDDSGDNGGGDDSGDNGGDDSGDNGGGDDSGDNGGGDDSGDNGGDDSTITLDALPVVITNAANFTSQVTVSGGLQKLVSLDVSIEKNYASLSLSSDGTLLINALDVPTAGDHTLQVLVTFPKTGSQELVFTGRSSDITLNAVSIAEASQQLVSFNDISQDIGLDTEDTYKYGGPSIGDVNNDGYYDFILANHNYIPPQLVTNNGNTNVTIERLLPNSQDFHGNALGDYDNDGDLDVMVALGGANGTSPTSYTLLKNNDGVFENVSIAAGINTPARGRSPRWADFDQDGDLDLMLANATTPNYDGPIQLFYRNMGDGTFTPVRVAGVESTPSERLLITDFNGDQIDDIILYSPLSLWQGNGDFSFTNVSADILPAAVNNVWGINAITDVDVNNDGNLDLYLAFGKTHYQLSRKSIDFNPADGELNIHDDGETGTTLIDFVADGEITLSDLNLTYRQHNGDFPIFLGADKNRHVVKASGFQPTQLPAEMANAEESLVVSQASAVGWPETRTVNGLYIGHTGNGQWKAEWVRDQDIYWNISFTLSDLTDVNYDWVPNNRNSQDILLINNGETFVDASTDWQLPKGGDHWGVTHGDFNNDGWNDLFVYRYGFLQERISDLLLLNTGDNSFVTTHMHGAFDPTDNGHGDMGQAFDFNKDGAVDMLNGSEEGGHWYLWQNETTNDNNYLLVDVGYSPLNNVDSMAAQVIVTLATGDVFKKRIGSAGEVFSAGIIDTVHFGLGQTSNVTSVQVKWRNGESVTLPNISANTLVTTDDASNPVPVSIDLGKSLLKLRESTNAQIVPTFMPLNAVPDLEWSSSNTSIASIDANGVITAHSVGETIITATSTADNSVSANLTVEVGDFEIIHVTELEISGDNQVFYEGQQVQLTAEITPSDADDLTVTWSSSNEVIATVDANGIVTNNSVGNATITATAQGSEIENAITDEVNISVEQFKAQTIGYDNESKYKADIPVNQTFEVTVDYNAGSGKLVSDAGIKFYLRELNSGWVPVNDLIIDEFSSAGTNSGSVSVFFDIADLTLTADLPEGNFYFLYVKFTNDQGESIDKGLWPLNLVAESADPVDSCETNLICGNTNGEGEDTSEWYAYARDNFATDLSSELSVSSAQSNGGNGSIKFAFNDAGVEQHFILQDLEFSVATEGSYQLNADVLGANLSTGSDYVIEISFRPADQPQSSHLYTLWHKLSADQWHSLSVTKTLPIGDYIVGFKVFSPGFANTLTLDYYVDNVVVTQQ